MDNFLFLNTCTVFIAGGGRGLPGGKQDVELFLEVSFTFGTSDL